MAMVALKRRPTADIMRDGSFICTPPSTLLDDSSLEYHVHSPSSPSTMCSSPPCMALQLPPLQPTPPPDEFAARPRSSSLRLRVSQPLSLPPQDIRRTFLFHLALPLRNSCSLLALQPLMSSSYIPKPHTFS